MKQRGQTGPAPGEPFEAPSAVDLLGDALLIAARRPGLLVPLVLLDGLLAFIIAANVPMLSDPIGLGPVDLPVSPGQLAGLLLPALLPFGGLEAAWQDSLPSYLAGGRRNAIWIVMTMLISAALSVVFLIRLASDTRSGEGRSDRASGVGRVFQRLMVLSILLLFVPAFVGGPFVIAGLVMNRVESSRVPLLVASVVLVGVAFLLLRFSFDALIVDDVPALEAIARSWTVVSQQPLAALRLLALSACIAAGTRVLWISLIETPTGLVTSIIGNAFISTALALARMKFYRIVHGAIPLQASSRVVPGI